MVKTFLNLMSLELQTLNVPYQYNRWRGGVNGVYFVGDYTETATITEDGEREYTFILTGTTRGEWLELENYKEIIESHFPREYGLRFATDSGAVAIFYENALPIETGEADLKRLQINLAIKCWKGMI